jgi:hypothetical protein
MPDMSAHTALAITAFLALAPQTAAAQGCDRACLTGILSGYLTAMAAHDPSKVAISARVRITEDTKPIALGDGLWRNITALRPYRQDFIDVREGAAAAFTVAEEAGKPALVAVRLMAVSRRITHDEPVRVATLYPAGLRAGSLGAVPGATDSPNTLVTFEAFKVYGSQIHAAEAILETLPIGAPSGWDK